METEKVDANDIKLFPLYHGTDMRIVLMDKEERISFRQDCIDAGEYLWNIFQPYLPTLQQFKETLESYEGRYLWGNLINSIKVAYEMHRGNDQYQYDSFHLTNNILRAKNYAVRSFAFGEIGLIPYRLYEAIQVLDLKEFDPTEAMQKKIEKITSFAEDDDNADPAIAIIPSLDLRLLEVERYGSLENAILECGPDLSSCDLIFHYKGDVEINPNFVYVLKQQALYKV